MLSFRLRLLLAFYSLALWAGRRFIPLVTTRRARESWDFAERIAASKSPHISSVPAGSATWIHAASLGEAKLVVRFLELLKRKHPAGRYLLTATTRAGVDFLTTVTGHCIVACRFLPLDSARLMKAMLESYSITRVWLMETELWPNLLLSCVKKEIPVGIINGRLEEKSFGFYHGLKSLFEPLFRHLSPVFAQNDTYAERFIEMGVARQSIHVTGNLKSCVEIAVPSPSERAALRSRLAIADQDMVVVAGCVHPCEGNIIRKAFSLLRARGMMIKMIVVPRHLKATKQILEEIGDDAMHLIDAASEKPFDICVIEKIGILDGMYRLCDLAFIGGTFVPVGGHNVWEPAQYGVPVIFGPDYHTQIEGCMMLIKSDVGFTISNPEQLARQIARLLGDGRPVFLSARSDFVEAMKQHTLEIEHLIP